MKPAKAVGVQYAALPYRIRRWRVEILLITSRETRRWVIPKGWPIPGLSPFEGAAKEANEEAGVVGEVETQPIGSYAYVKQLKRERGVTVQVIVFPLRVEDQAAAYKEEGQRTMTWLPYAKAAGLVTEPSLSRLIREFGRARTPRLLARLAGKPRWAALFRRRAGGDDAP